MPKRKTNREWVNEVRGLVGDEYTFLEKYVNNRVKIAVRHNKCGHVYKVEPKAFLAGNRCPNCNPSRRKTTAEFKTEVYKLVGNEYSVVSEYTGHHEYVTMKHERCGRVYKVVASDFLKGRRCRECHFAKQRKTNEEWLLQVKSLAGDDYTFLEEYEGDNVKIKYRHSCGAEHKVTPNNFINGTRCPVCKESNGEANIRRYLTEKGISFERQKTFKGLVYEKPLRYDFYIPEHNILIEFQGEQHYKPIPVFGGEESFRKQCERDSLKRKYANNNKIRLIEIPYTYDSYEKVSNLLDSTIFNNE